MKKLKIPFWIWIIISLALMLGIAALPQSEALGRGALQYLGIFAAMLLMIISKAVPDWAAAMFACTMVALYGIGDFAGAFAGFANTAIWMTIAIYMLCAGIANSGFLRRLALYFIRLFPRHYMGQVMAFLSTVLILCPLIPSATAKVGILSPLACEISRQSGHGPHSKEMQGLWSIAMIGGFYLGCCFLTGSAQVAIMAGFAKEQFVWGRWALAFVPFLTVGLIALFLFCLLYCRPGKGEAGELPAEYINSKLRELGPMGKKEKQGAGILGVALLFWLTESIHGIDALYITMFADVAMACCGLLSAREVSTKVSWNLVLFVGGLFSFSAFMGVTGVDAFIAGLLGPVISPLIERPYIFFPCICIIVIVMRYVVVSLLCTVTIMLAVFAPLLELNGISPTVFVFVVFMTAGNWNASYSNPLAMGMIAFAGEENISYPDSRAASWLYCIICLAASVLSIPVWQALGLC